MEKAEIELIEQLRESNYEVDRLYKAHNDFEKQIEKYENRVGLSSSEDIELHNLKKLKLNGKEKLLELVETLK